MLWIKSFHIISMVAWFAGLFYLPRLFVYHADATDKISIERFKIMEWRLFYCITTPAAILTAIFGFILLYDYAWKIYKHAMWLHLKLGLIFLLVIYHIYCGIYLSKFKHDKNKKSAKFYRFFNEIPTLFLVSIVILVVVKPL